MEKQVAVAALAGLFASPVFAACGDPVEALSRYTGAHMQADAEAVYNLTASNVRGEKFDFIADYVDAFKSSDRYQDYFASHFTYDVSVESVSEDIAVLAVDSEYPDTRKIALEMAEENRYLRFDNPSDWDQLVDYVEENGVDTKQFSDKFYMTCESDDWRVLRPRLLK